MQSEKFDPKKKYKTTYILFTGVKLDLQTPD